MNKISSLKRIALALGAGSVLVTAMAGATFAATDGGSTSATVNAMISVTAPATIAFGAGLPGDTLSALDNTVTVTSNNSAGYTLAVQASNFTGTPAGSIPATALSFRDGIAAYAPLTAANTDLTVATTSAISSADGDTHSVDAQLVLPFVAAGSYAGTFTFTASNL